ncbi:MAG: hypothetical protein M1438_09665, partial [Deltaproteobacteria bacterium]|nr:hypothetical protein [Deltaproteobacteria bacterium]
MIAATIIAKNPEKFGFRNVPYQPPIKMDKIQVNEPTSLRAAAFAVNMQPEDIQILNPELLRGVTPPNSPNYSLNIPPNSKELFNKNITLARIEYPGVASRSIQTATRSRHYYRRAQAEERDEPEEAPAASKSSSRHAAYSKAPAARTKAAASRKFAAHATYARKGKIQEAKETPTPAVQASMFGTVGASSKHGTVRNSQAKGKPQTIARAGSKKSVEAGTAKKNEPAPKAKGKVANKKANGNTSSGKSKDKVSKSKSKAKSAALFASAAK